MILTFNRPTKMVDRTDWTCQIIAHRGGQPENTLSAFKWAQSHKADAIEFDVHLTRDGHPMVFHDNTLDRSTTGTGNWLNLDRTDVTRVRIRGTQEHIPDLDEVLTNITCPIFLEVKSPDPPMERGIYPGMVDCIVARLRQFSRLDSTVVISFNWMLLQQLKLVEPRIQTGMLVERDQLDAYITPTTNSITLATCHHLLDWARKLDCTWLDVDHHLISTSDRKAIIAAVQAESRRLGVWTINDDDSIRTWLQAGVHGITTDHPDVAQHIRIALKTDSSR